MSSHTLVRFGASWCEPCTALDKALTTALRRFDSGSFKLRKHDIEKDPEPAQQFGVRSIPTLVVLSPDGEEVARYVGTLVSGELHHLLRNVLEATPV